MSNPNARRIPGWRKPPFSVSARVRGSAPAIAGAERHDQGDVYSAHDKGAYNAEKFDPTRRDVNAEYPKEAIKADKEMHERLEKGLEGTDDNSIGSSDGFADRPSPGARR
jgi:hypothetical protein